jgi:hypothetical protein
MCCSVTPGKPVEFRDTVLYGAEVLGPAGAPVHVLGYQNQVQGAVGLLQYVPEWLALGGGNAMILPFPAVPGTMTAANVIDTSACREILQDVARAVRYDDGFQPASLMPRGRGRAPAPIVFEAAGIYTVVLAGDPRDIPSVLDQVPYAKRPTVNPALFEAYARWYPGWTIALCCFNNRRAKLANPLLWWYEPIDPGTLFLPALDCHTGDVPDVGGNVIVDHVVAVGSYRMTGGNWVEYRSAPAAVRPYLCDHVLGERYRGTLPNGDFVCALADLLEEAAKPRDFADLDARDRSRPPRRSNAFLRRQRVAA